MDGLVVIRFDADGRICNIDELFGGVDAGYGPADRNGTRVRRVDAWLNEADRVIMGSDEHHFIWGRVLVGQTDGTRENLGGTHRYYRIHPHDDSNSQRATRNCAAGCIV